MVAGVKTLESKIEIFDQLVEKTLASSVYCLEFAFLLFKFLCLITYLTKLTALSDIWTVFHFSIFLPSLRFPQTWLRNIWECPFFI